MTDGRDHGSSPGSNARPTASRLGRGHVVLVVLHDDLGGLEHAVRTDGALDHGSRSLAERAGRRDRRVDRDVGLPIGQHEAQVRRRSAYAARRHLPAQANRVPDRRIAAGRQLGGRQVVDERVADAAEGEIGDDRQHHRHEDQDPPRPPARRQHRLGGCRYRHCASSSRRGGRSQPAPQRDGVEREPAEDHPVGGDHEACVRHRAASTVRAPTIRSSASCLLVRRLGAGQLVAADHEVQPGEGEGRRACRAACRRTASARRD